MDGITEVKKSARAINKTYSYELWDGKKVIGHYHTQSQLMGITLRVATISEFKREYNRRYETVEVPITYRCISDDGVDYTIRKVLDVRKKSKRQRAIIANDGVDGVD